jgi:RTX calcium-binding nonapeptide repeat (4 copies)
MPNVILPELIVSAYLDSSIPGTQRRALEILGRIEQSALKGTERWLVLAPSFNRASGFIAEQDLTQSVEFIREDIERRGIEIISGTAVYAIWKQTVNGSWSDPEILYAIGQGYSVFALRPEALAQIVQACEQCYGVPLSTLQILSGADLEPSLSQNSNPDSEGGDRSNSSGGDRSTNNADASSDTIPVAQSTLLRSGIKFSKISNTLISWLFASLIPFISLKQEPSGTLPDDEVAESERFRPLPEAGLHANKIEVQDTLQKQAPSTASQLSQSKNLATDLALRKSKSQTTILSDLVGGDRHPFFVEKLSAVHSRRKAAIIITDLAEDTASHTSIGQCSSFQVSPAPEKLPKFTTFVDLSTLVDILHPIVVKNSDPHPQGETPPHSPSKPRPHHTKPQPTPVSSPSLPIPFSTPDNLSTSPDPNLDPIVEDQGGSPAPTPDVNNGGSDPVQPSGFNPPIINGLGGHFVFEISPGAGQIIITHFGGVGTGTAPSQSVIEEADTLKFMGDAAFSAQNMMLTQKGDDLIIHFEGVSGTEVILKNFQMENLDNLLRPSASADLANILFDGQDNPQDRYDIFDAAWDLNAVLNLNTVTFLNDQDNQVTGFEGSDNIINGQGGDDTLTGLGGNDVLRGGDGNDVLRGGAGNNILTGNAGSDTFVLFVGGYSQINDFTLGEDQIELPRDIAYEQLNIRQGTGNNSSDSFIFFDKKLIALVKNVEANTLTSSNFFQADNHFGS